MTPVVASHDGQLLSLTNASANVWTLRPRDDRDGGQSTKRQGNSWSPERILWACKNQDLKLGRSEQSSSAWWWRLLRWPLVLEDGAVGAAEAGLSRSLCRGSGH